MTPSAPTTDFQLMPMLSVAAMTVSIRCTDSASHPASHTHAHVIQAIADFIEHVIKTVMSLGMHLVQLTMIKQLAKWGGALGAPSLFAIQTV